MSFPQVNAYRLKEISYLRGEDVFDVSQLFEMLDIYEDIETPYINGVIYLKDTESFLDRLVVNPETDFIRVSFVSGDGGSDRLGNDLEYGFDQTFRVTSLKRSLHTKPGESTNSIEFISDEFVRNLSTKISRSFNNMSPDKAIERILQTDIKTKKPILSHGPYNDIRYVMPYSNPYQACNKLAKIALLNGVSDSVFYEDTKGFHLKSLGQMASVPAQTHHFYNTPSGTEAEGYLKPFNAVENVYPSGDAIQSIMDSLRTGQRGMGTYGYNRLDKTFSFDPSQQVFIPAHDSSGNDVANAKRTRMDALGRLFGQTMVFVMNGFSGRHLGDVIVYERLSAGSPDSSEKSLTYSGNYLISRINHRLSPNDYVQMIEGLTLSR